MNMTNPALQDDEEQNKVELNGTAEDVLATARDAAANAASEETKTDSVATPAEPPAPETEQAPVASKPTYSDDEIMAHAQAGTDYTQDELDAMTDEQYANYAKIAQSFRKEDKADEPRVSEGAKEKQDKLTGDLEMADRLQKMSQYVMEQTDGDEDFADVHDEAKYASDYLATSPMKFSKMDDTHKQAITERITKLYNDANKRRGHFETAVDAINKGYWTLGNMIYQGGTMMKPGELTQEDAENIQGSMQTKQDEDIFAPQKIGEIENIRSVGDAIDWLSDSVGENVPRGLASLLLSTAGAVAGGAVGGPVGATVGAITFGSLGTMAMNTGEAVQDQMDENRNDGDIRNSRGWALAQGAGYSLLDGAFGASYWGGKMLGSMMKRIGLGEVAKSAGIKEMLELGKKATAKKLGKELLVNGVLGEGFQEAAQSQGVGRAIRYLQTGSAFKKDESLGDAFLEAVNEFAGGAAAGLTFGLLGGAPAHISAKRAVGIYDNIMGAVKDSAEYQKLSPTSRLLVTRRLINDGYVDTSGLIDDRVKESLKDSNDEIDAEIKRMSESKNRKEALEGQSAQLFLDLFKSQYTTDEMNQIVANARHQGKAPRLSMDPASWKQEKIADENGQRALLYTNDKTHITMANLVDTNGKVTDKWVVNNDPTRKIPVIGKGELVLDGVEAAMKRAEDLDLYNQFREDRMREKAAIVTPVFNKLFGERGVQWKPVDKPNAASGDSRATSTASYNPRTRMVELNLDKINSLGSLYITLIHERAHADICSFLLKSGKFMKKVGGATVMDWDAFDKAREELLSRIEGAERMSELNRNEGAKPDKNGFYGDVKNAWGRSKGTAGEEMVAEYASVDEIARHLTDAKRGYSGLLADKIRSVIGLRMAGDMGLDPKSIMPEDVAQEIGYLFERGFVGEKALDKDAEAAKLSGNAEPAAAETPAETAPETSGVVDDGGVADVSATVPKTTGLKPAIENGMAASYSPGSNVRRADGRTFTKTGTGWKAMDTGDEVDDRTATKGGYEELYVEPPVSAENETKTEQETAPEQPKKDPASAPEPEIVEKAPETPQEASVEPEKPTTPVEPEKPVEAVVEAKEAPKAEKAEKDAVKTEETPKKASKKETDKKSGTDWRKLSGKTKKALVKQTGVSADVFTPEVEDRWIRLDELPDGTKVKAGGLTYTKIGKVDGKAESKWKSADGKTVIQTTLARLGEFSAVDAEKETPAATEEKPKTEAKATAPESKKEAPAKEPPKQPTAKQAQMDEALDRTLDTLFKDVVNDAQRGKIKELSRKYGEVVDIVPSEADKSVLLVEFKKDGEFAVLDKTGREMSADEVNAIGSDNGAMPTEKEAGDSIARMKSILSMPQISGKDGNKIAEQLFRSMGGAPAALSGLSDDVLFARAMQKDDFEALRTLWGRWVATNGKLRQYFRDRGVDDGDIDLWIGGVWRYATRAMHESAILEEDAERGTPLGKTVTADGFLYSTASSLWSQKEALDEIWRRAAEEAEAEKARVRRAEKKAAMNKLRAAAMGKFRLNSETKRRFERALGYSKAVDQKYKRPPFPKDATVGDVERLVAENDQWLCRQCIPHDGKAANVSAREEVKVRMLESLFRVIREGDETVTASMIQSKLSDAGLSEAFEGEILDELFGIVENNWSGKDKKYFALWTGKSFDGMNIAKMTRRIVNNLVRRKQAEVVKNGVAGTESLDSMEERFRDADELMAQESPDDDFGDAGLAAVGTVRNVLSVIDENEEERYREKYGMFDSPYAAMRHIIDSGVLSPAQRAILNALIGSWSLQVHLAEDALVSARDAGANLNTVKHLESVSSSVKRLDYDNPSIIVSASNALNMKPLVYLAKLNALMDQIGNGIVGGETLWKIRRDRKLSGKERAKVREAKAGMFSKEFVKNRLNGLYEESVAYALGYNSDELMSAMNANGDEAMRWCVWNIEHGKTFSEIEREVEKGALRDLPNRNGSYDVSTLLDRAYTQYGWINPSVRTNSQRQNLIAKLIERYRSEQKFKDIVTDDNVAVMSAVREWLRGNGVEMSEDEFVSNAQAVLHDIIKVETAKDKRDAYEKLRRDNHAIVSSIMASNGGNESAVIDALKERGYSDKEANSAMTHWRAIEKSLAERKARDEARASAGTAERGLTDAQKEDANAAFEASNGSIPSAKRILAAKGWNAETLKKADDYLGYRDRMRVRTNEENARSLPDETKRSILEDKIRQTGEGFMDDGDIVDFAVNDLGMSELWAKAILRRERINAPEITDAELEDMTIVRTQEELDRDIQKAEAANEQLRKDEADQEAKRIAALPQKVRDDAERIRALVEKHGAENVENVLKREKLSQKRIDTLYENYRRVYPEQVRTLEEERAFQDEAAKRSVRNKTVDNDISFKSTGVVTDPNLVAPMRASLERQGLVDEAMKARIRVHDGTLDEQARDLISRTDDFDKAVVKGQNFEPLTDVEVHAIGIAIGERMSLARDGHLSAEDAESNDKAIDNLVQAVTRGLSGAGAALRAAQLGFDLRTRDSLVYMRNQMRAQFEKEAVKRYGSLGAVAHAAEIEEKLKEFEARMAEQERALAEQHDIIEKQRTIIAEKEKKADDATLERVRREAFAQGQKSERAKRTERIKRLVSLGADADKAGDAADAMAAFGDMMGLRSRHAGKPSVTLTEDMRNMLSVVLAAFGNDTEKTRAAILEDYGEPGAEMLDRYVAEEDAKSVPYDGRKSTKTKIRNERISARANKVKEIGASAFERRTEDRLVRDAARIADADDETTLMAALGDYARNFFKLIAVNKSELSIDEMVSMLVTRMNEVVPGRNFTPESARDALLGRDRFKPMTKKSAENDYKVLKTAQKLALEGKLREAANAAGIEHKSDAEMLEELDRRLGNMLNVRLNRFESRINEDNNEALRKEIHELIAAINDIRSGKPTGELITKYLDMAVGMKDYRRQRSLLERINSRIEMYERRIAENDFEPAPKRDAPDNDKEIAEIKFAMRKLERLRERFKHERTAWQLKKKRWLARHIGGLIELLGETKALVGAMDLSSMLRQGGQMTWAHPLLFAKNFKKIWGIMMSDEASENAFKDIWKRPNAKYYQLAGIDFTDWGDNAASKEDVFLLNKFRMITRNKFLRKGIEMSERAFSMYLNLMRADVFDAMIESSPHRDASKFTHEELKAIGNYINIASQRGAIEQQGKLGKALDLANAVLWSPRNIISRWQFLTNTAALLNPLANPYGSDSAQMRKMFAKETARYLTGVAAAILFTKLMADLFRDDDEPPQDIVLDPRSSDFLKVRIGNTRLDFLSGLQPMFVFASRMWTGKTRNLRGEVNDLNRYESVGRFMRSKFSPMSSFIWDVATGENFDRQDISWNPADALKNDKEVIGAPRYLAKSVFCPLVFSDIVEQAKYGGIGSAVLTSLLTFLGAGVQAFDPYTYKQMSADFRYFKRLYKEADTAEERQRLIEYHPMLKRIGSITAQNKHVERIKRQIRDIQKRGGNTETLQDVLEREQKRAINLMAGVKNPMDTE